jgi:nitrile hydratase
LRARFGPGDLVRVRAAYPPGHVRTPFFVRGRRGVVDQVAGSFRNPEELAYGRRDGPRLPLYRVRFSQAELFADCGPSDSVVVDLLEPWLEPAGDA